MKRKVVRHGPSSLTVSLPSKWAKSNNIKPGDEIDVEEKEDRLMIASDIRPEKKEITVDMPGKEDYFQRPLVIPYVKGYDIINVRYDDSKTYDRIQESAKLLMGFEIVENKEHSCRLMNISTRLEQNFEILLNRLFATGITFAKELLQRLKEKEQTGSLLAYEFNANKLSLFCRRVINTGHVPSTRHYPTGLYSMVGHLEEFVDHFRHIVRTLGDRKVVLNKKTIGLFELCIKAQELNFKIYNRSSKEKDSPDIGLFVEHRRIRKSIMNNHDCFKGDQANSYICARIMGAMDTSHHINEELFD